MSLSFYRTGEAARLGPRIAESGEATIHELDGDPGRLAKIHHDGARDPDRAAKLAALIAQPPSDPSLGGFHRAFAWPEDALIGTDGQPAGLVIPAVPGARSLTALGSPKLRRRKASEINWHYLHAVAANLAVAVDHAHAQGFVVGDLQPDNVLVDDRALVTLIDCDSWQVPDPRAADAPPFPCPVGSEGFTAPELIGKRLARIVRDAAADRFALAVLIFQLLLGRHPWTGEWIGGGEPPTRDSLIKQGEWPHRHGARLVPAKGAVPLEVLAPDLRALFRRAFEDGIDDPAARPSGWEWQEALCLALADLETCAERPHHHYLPAAGPCPWCARLAATGSDAFPAPEAPADPFWPLALAFERALARGDARMALELWTETPALAARPALTRYAPRMTAIGEGFDALDGWIAHYRVALEAPRPDWSALARAWESDARLDERRLFAGEEIAGRPALAVVDEVRERALRIPLAPPEKLLVTPQEAIRAAELRRHPPVETEKPATTAPKPDDAGDLDIPPMPVSLADPARRREEPVPPRTPTIEISYEIAAGWAGLRPAVLALSVAKPTALPALALVDTESGRVLAGIPAQRVTARGLRIAFEQPEGRPLLELRAAVAVEADRLTIAHPPERHRRIGARRPGAGGRRAVATS